MQVRVEFRAVRVRQLRKGSDSNLPVGRFRRVSTSNDPNPQAHDLLDVLERIFKRLVGKVDVTSPAEDDPESGSQQIHHKRTAIEISSVVRSGRLLYLEFDWSSNPPRRILNLDSGAEYLAQPGDSGMNLTTVVIAVPSNGHSAFIGVQQRSGVVSIFEPALEKWFREDALMEDFRLHISGFVPDQFWDDFLSKGIVLQLDLEKNTLPKDIVDFADDETESTGTRDAGSVNVVIRVDQGAQNAARAWLRDKLSVLSQDQDGPGVFLYDGGEYSSLKSRLSYQGMERTLAIGPEPSGRIAPAFPIEVPELPNGSMDLAVFRNEVVSLMNDVLLNANDGD